MSKVFNDNRGRGLRGMVLLAGLTGLTACAEGQMPGFLQAKPGDGGETVARAATGGITKSSERDVEAPEIFQTSEAGLWDGRPSLGGVWVAHPDVKDPERVIIRNEQNGKFVIGALFRRERQSPGPRLQVSSDAAAALGVLAGSPSNLNVVALRREEVIETAPDALTSIPDAPDVAADTLDPVAPSAAVADVAAAALDATPQPAVATAPAAAPQLASAAVAAPSPLRKPFIQIGIFSVEQNAKNTATAMRQAGMVPTIKKHNSKGKVFWRVVVGPAQNKSELATLLNTIKGTGFADAYAVTN